jgi:ribonuclease HII
MPLSKIDCSSLPLAPDFQFETALWAQGTRAVAGIDEAGRGALAGPVAAAVIIFPPEPGLYQALMGVRDSKLMSSKQREVWAERLPGMALAHAVGYASNQEIDAFGIVPATRLAVQRAIIGLAMPPEHLLIDYLDLPDCPLPQTPLVKGDSRSLSIAAASILAKVSRDKHLQELDVLYPGYGFAQNKGYGTAAHQQALSALGFSPVHRRSFRLKKLPDRSGI